MPLSTSAYLADIVDACDAVAAPISHARLIVGFRNRLVHEYPQIDDQAVCCFAERDTPVLQAECAAYLGQVGDAD